MAADADLPVRGPLGHLDPLEAGGHLRGDRHVTESWLIRNYAAQSLVEPAPDSVEAVMQEAPGPVPMLPGTGGSVVEHVQVAGIAMLLEHAVEPVRLSGEGGPFRQHGDAYKPGREMAAVDLFSPSEEFFPHGRHQGVRNGPDQHRIDHIHLGPGSVGGIFWMVECLVDQCRKVLVTLAELLRILGAAEQGSDLPKV